MIPPCYIMNRVHVDVVCQFFSVSTTVQDSRTSPTKLLCADFVSLPAETDPNCQCFHRLVGKSDDIQHVEDRTQWIEHGMETASMKIFLTEMLQYIPPKQQHKESIRKREEVAFENNGAVSSELF